MSQLRPRQELCKPRNRSISTNHSLRLNLEIVEYRSGLVECPSTILAHVTLETKPIIPVALHPNRAASRTVNAAPPPNHPEEPRTSLLIREKIKNVHKGTSEANHKNLI